MKWLPSWLGKIYATLYSEFADKEFSLEDAVKIINRPYSYVKVAISQLCKFGWCLREDRGVYRLLKPLECILTLANAIINLDKIPCKEYIPLIRKTITEIYEIFTSNLLAIILFGSIARGEAKSNSDIDLLIIVNNLPKSYFKRASILAQVVSKTRSERIKLWSKKIYTSLQILAYTPEELKSFHSFYFDLAFDGIILYSRNGYAENFLNRVRKEIELMKARKIYTSRRKWYWIIGL